MLHIQTTKNTCQIWDYKKLKNKIYNINTIPTVEQNFKTTNPQFPYISNIYTRMFHQKSTTSKHKLGSSKEAFCISARV